MHTTIVSTAVLAQHLTDPDWVILDCQHDLVQHAFGREAYARGHIPGARFVSMEDDLAGVKTGRNGRHPMPSVDALGAVFGRLGIGDRTQVVVYDSSQNSYSGRLWWSLKWLGHDAVAVLDGGLALWTTEGRALNTEGPRVVPVRFTPRVRPAMNVDAALITAHLGNGGLQVVDARAADRYSGAQESIDPVGGHIPGALNRFWKNNVEADGRFKAADALRAEFEALLGGIRPEQVVHQCGSGVTACHNLMAMQIAGLAGGRLYPGSWSEWCADPARPVATGTQP